MTDKIKNEKELLKNILFLFDGKICICSQAKEILNNRLNKIFEIKLRKELE